MEVADWATIGVIVTLGGLLWRQIAALVTGLSRQMGALTADVRQVSECLSQLEGCIAGSTGRPFPRVSRHGKVNRSSTE